jgi:hypothetical protein
MIQMPRRSVTRFFIPLIDVLTLLFCIYLLLPIVKTPSDSADDDGLADDGGSGPLTSLERLELARLRQQAKDFRDPTAFTEAQRQELDRLRKEKLETLQQRLAIRVLEIDAATGKLFHYDPERVEIRTEGEARALIERQKREAGGRELYYLLLFPRKVTGYPEEQQIKQYKRWFEGVPFGIDNPRAAP